MAKTSEKVVADQQPESQRGKSRFDVQPRSNRMVLPDRPPREIDNEIVSILLGGDPTSLTTPTQEGNTSPVAPALHPIHPEEDFSLSAQSNRENESPVVSDATDIARQVQVAFSPGLPQNNVPDSRSSVSSVVKARSKTQISPEKSASTGSTRRISTGRRDSSLPISNVGKSVVSVSENPHASEMTISSFEEFTERWKHGMRKGQLKVCEVLYYKTHALGETECVTSFSEMGRLSGLKIRQCFNIIAQLEALKFVERTKSEASSNKKDQGSLIRFFLFPKS